MTLPKAKLPATQQTSFTDEQKPLPVGKYGAKKEKTEPNERIRNSLLRVVNYNGTFDNKDGTKSHNYLVASTNGIPGTAFLSFNLHPAWLSLEAYSVAFNDGEPVDGTDEKRVSLFQSAILDQIETTLKENNTPEDLLDEKRQEALNKYIKRIQISLGQWFDLQKATGLEPDLDTAFESAVGAEVAGHVVEGYKDDTAEVKRFYVPR